MAKQSGVHQLRGKIGEMSYYRQAGVVPGLVRRINQGMSQRVKTSDEFANTRLNNDEFKTANYFASWAYRSVRPQWRAMFRRFAVAGLTKRILEAIKSGTGNWGERIPSNNYGYILEDGLLNYAKLGQYTEEYGELTYSVSAGGEQDDYSIIDFGLNVSADKVDELMAEGIDGLRIMSSTLFANQREHNELFAGVDVPGFESEDFSSGSSTTLHIESAIPSAETFHFSPTDWGRAQSGNAAGLVFINVIMPFKIVNGVRHVLQEKCTFVCSGAPLRYQE